MSVHAAVLWLTVAVAVVCVVAAALQLLAAARGAKRIMARVEGYGALPVVDALHRAEADVARLEGSLTQAGPLMARAAVAVDVIRRGPIPPEFIAAFRTLRRLIP